jgi:WD40 repeat protein/tetratricopeptide (TPR) repeat protein
LGVAWFLGTIFADRSWQLMQRRWQRVCLAMVAMALPVGLSAEEPAPLPPDHGLRIAKLLTEAKLTGKYDATDLTKLVVLGDTLLDADRIEDARTAYLQAGAIQYEAVPKVVARHRLARIRAFEGDYDGAILIYRDVIAQMTEAHATSGVRYNERYQCHLCDVVTDLAEALVALGRSEEVLVLPPEAAAIMERQTSSDFFDRTNRRLPRFLSARASALESLDRWNVAEAERTRLWQMQRDLTGGGSPLGLAEAETKLAANLGHQGKTGQAIALLGTAITTYRKLLPPLDPRLVAALGERGRVELIAAQRPYDALKSLREATAALVATGARDGKRQENRRRRFQSLFRLQVQAAWGSRGTASPALLPPLAIAAPAPAPATSAPAIRHGGPVGALAFLPDGSQLVSGSLDGSIILWDYRAKRANARLRDKAVEGVDNISIIQGDHPIFASWRYGPPRLWSVDGTTKPALSKDITGARQMSRDGRTVLVTTFENFLLDAKGGSKTAIETGEIPQLLTLIDGSDHVASTTRKREGDDLCIHAVASGQRVKCVVIPTYVQTLLPLPGGKQILASGETIHLLDLPSLEIIRTIRLEAFPSAKTLAMSPDRTRLAAGFGDGRAALIDFVTGAIVARLEGHSGAVDAVAFSPDGETLATASADTSVRLWSGKDGASLGILGLEPRFARHAATVKTARFFDDDTHVASGDQSGSVRLWEVASGVQRAEFKTEGEAEFAAVSGAGKPLVTAGFSIEMRDRQTGDIVRTLPRHRDTSPVVETAMTNGGYLMAADTDHFLDVFDPDGKRIGGTKLDEGPYLSAAPKGDIVAVTLFGTRTELWNTRLAKKIATIADGVLSGSFSADGSVFGRITGWLPETYEAASGRSRYVPDKSMIPDLPYQQWRGAALCHPDRAMFGFSKEKRFFYWSRLAAPPQELSTDAAVSTIRCAPDGSTLAAGLANGDLLLIDSATGTLRSRLSGHHAKVTGLDFSLGE